MEKRGTGLRRELRYELIARRGARRPLDFGPLAAGLKKALAERIPGAEMDVPLTDPGEREAVAATSALFRSSAPPSGDRAVHAPANTGRASPAALTSPGLPVREVRIGRNRSSSRNPRSATRIRPASRAVRDGWCRGATHSRGTLPGSNRREEGNSA